MSQLNSKRFADIIQHAYTDTGMLNEIIMQRYLELLRLGVLKEIFPQKLFSSSAQSSDKFFSLYDVFSEASGETRSHYDGDAITSSEAINLNNERDKERFDKQSYKFLYTLRHTVFEDGMDNDATEMFSRMTKQNKYVAICWLHDLWADHQEEPAVVEGIIRLIGGINDKAYWKTLMSIVRAGLSDKNESVQEAAVMVTEAWRTLACYQALQQTHLPDGWIKDYAIEVMEELEEELRDEIHQKN